MADAPPRGSRRPTFTTRAAISIAGRRRSILGSLLAEKAKKLSLSSSYRSKNRFFFFSRPSQLMLIAYWPGANLAAPNWRPVGTIM